MYPMEGKRGITSIKGRGRGTLRLNGHTEFQEGRQMSFKWAQLSQKKGQNTQYQSNDNISLKKKPKPSLRPKKGGKNDKNKGGR
jgi:hypothetical protein